MHPLALQKLWKLAGGRVPHLDKSSYDLLCETAGELQGKDGMRYWGVVGHQVRYRGHQLLHCYNFGNTTIDYPWRAQLLNFGHNVPARIVRGGTVRNRERGNSLLDRVIDPYLAFGFEAEAAQCEHLQPGMLVTAGPAQQAKEFDIALPGGAAVPVGSGILYYYMMKRLPFRVEMLGGWVPQGGINGMECFRIKLREPVVMEPGWPVLMLEKDRWFWGVVCR